MKRWQRYCAGLAAVIGLAPEAFAQQFPGIPSPTPPPAAPAAAGGDAAAPAAPAAPQANLFSFLCPTQAQKKACKECLCQSQLGLLLNNTLAPVTAFSGGIMPPLCPGTPSAAELADQGAVGAAAKIKKEEAEAKARRAAVRYLGTVSCHYFPGAEKALIGSLRGDTNECVRWEAAMSLGSGCCCTKKTIQALAVCVSGTDVDGFPSEISPRVKAAAEVALLHCLECYKEIVPVKEKEKVPEGARPKTPETTPAPQPTPEPTARLTPAIRQIVYYELVDSKPMGEVVIGARQVVAQLKDQQTAAKAQAAAKTPSTVLPSGERSMYAILTNAIKPPPRAASAAGADEKRLVPQTTQVASLAPKPPLIELEPPTDLYHVLMARRQERLKEAQALAPSEPTIARMPSYAQPAPAPISSPLVAMAPGRSETTTNIETPAATGVAASRGEWAAERLVPRASPYAGPANYETAGYTAGSGDSQPVSPSSAQGPYHIIGEGPKAMPSPAVFPAALTRPAPMSYWSNGSPITPASEVNAAPAAPRSWSPYHSPDLAPPAATAPAAPPGQPYPQFPAPGPSAPNQDPTWMPAQPQAQASAAPYPQMPSPLNWTRAEPPLSQASPPAQSTAQSPVAVPSVMQAQAPEPAQPKTPIAPTTPPNLAGLVLLLQNSPEAAQREWAVTRLVAESWTGQDEIVAALLGAAANDPEATVRSMCIRCLVLKKVHSVAATKVLQDLKGDVDSQVRHEAAQALASMTTP